MKIILIRHGEAKNKGENPSLTKAGRTQAKRVAKILSGSNPSKIFCSDQLRAKQTCEAFAANYIENNRLREIYRVIVGGPVRKGTDPERVKNDKQRADILFDKILSLNGKLIIIFTHGNIIKYFISKVLDIDAKKLWERLEVAPGSLSIIEVYNSKPRIRAIGFQPQCNMKSVSH